MFDIPRDRLVPTWYGTSHGIWNIPWHMGQPMAYGAAHGIWDIPWHMGHPIAYGHPMAYWTSHGIWDSPWRMGQPMACGTSHGIWDIPWHMGQPMAYGTSHCSIIFAAQRGCLLFHCSFGVSVLFLTTQCWGQSMLTQWNQRNQRRCLLFFWGGYEALILYLTSEGGVRFSSAMCTIFPLPPPGRCRFLQAYDRKPQGRWWIPPPTTIPRFWGQPNGDALEGSFLAFLANAKGPNLRCHKGYMFVFCLVFAVARGHSRE